MRKERVFLKWIDTLIEPVPVSPESHEKDAWIPLIHEIRENGIEWGRDHKVLTLFITRLLKYLLQKHEQEIIVKPLYHYCSLSAFIDIISSESIWLSSLSLSNDTMEGKLVSKIIDSLARRDGLDELSSKEIKEGIDILEEIFDGLGFCLSEDGNLLSQWRGYAADATGFSIGFSKEYLLELLNNQNSQEYEFILKKIEYEPTEQEKIVTQTYEKAKEVIKNNRLENTPRPGLVGLLNPEDQKRENEKLYEFKMSMAKTMIGLASKMYALKAIGFKEEKEWRLISYMRQAGDASYDYRALKDSIAPYRTVKLEKLKAERIVEVIIGPKNRTPIYIVESILKKTLF